MIISTLLVMYCVTDAILSSTLFTQTLTILDTLCTHTCVLNKVLSYQLLSHCLVSGYTRTNADTWPGTSIIPGCKGWNIWYGEASWPSQADLGRLGHMVRLL